jgi:multiple antibiotic resistance protein
VLDRDFTQLLRAILVVIGALLPIVNPIGSAPMFLAMTRGADGPTRSTLAWRIAINSFLLLFGSLIFGNFVLRLFGLSIPVVQVAGGLVLCRLGWKLLDDDAAGPAPVAKPDTPYDISRAFYPLTLPLTVDPGAMAVAVAIGANHSHNIQNVLVSILGAIVGVAAIVVCVWLAYRYAARVSAWLGHTRMMALLRLSAFIVLCIGVQIGWNGVKGLLDDLDTAATQGSRAAPATATGDGKR